MSYWWKSCIRSSHPRCFIKKVFWKTSRISQENRPVVLLKERLWHRCFPVNFAKFLRAAFLQSSPGGLNRRKEKSITLKSYSVPWVFCVEISTFQTSDWIHGLHSHCLKSVQIHSYFWSVFSCIRTKYGDLLFKSSYSVRIQENTDQK